MTPLPNPFISDPALPLPSSASSAAAPFPHSAAARPSVSPGVVSGSLPSGESDPSVMLDCAPGENRSPVQKEVQGSPAPVMNPSDAGLFDFARIVCLEARVRPGVSPEIVETSRDITEIDMVWADPPPIFLRAPRWERV